MTSATLKRKLAAILSADAVSYSNRMASDEEGTMRVLAGHRAVIDGLVEAHEGRVVNTAGDSILAEFASPVEAVRCAVEIQEALRTRNEALPLERRLAFRVGVNLGDVMVRGSDLLGDGVNVAARLQSIAEPGGICISSSIYDQITGKLNLGFIDIGEQELKNIPRPVRVYRVAGTHAPLMTVGGNRRTPIKWPWLIAGAAVAAALAATIAFHARETTPPAPPATPTSSQPRPPPQQEAPTSAANLETVFWESVRASNDPAQLQAYVDRYPDGAFAALARAKIDQLTAKTRRAAQKQAAPEPSPQHPESTARPAAAPPMAPGSAPVAAGSTPTSGPPQSERAAPSAPLAPGETVAKAVPRYDGRWNATRHCDAYEDRPEFTDTFPVIIENDVLVIEQGKEGVPGYFYARGQIGQDGRLTLGGKVVSKAQRSYGKEAPIFFDGRFDDKRFDGAGRQGGRRCTLTLERARY